ncbi:hypothetical protein [Sharpea porci]|uniref:hypothetical protein n=1 Tax=Sharpea porci TaxID=2652286 RepID=UPI002A91E2F7|nr:hypothetical protein [Sharpea porci]MDY5279475.1 hypothetical protein [Sharpea porci]
MEIITTTGFYGTGSSAITDLLKEYEPVSCKSDYELRFLFDPDRISDLEYNLIENPNRHNSSHALKRFHRNMSRFDHIWFVQRYSKYFENKFMPAVERFMESIVEMEYCASWHYDVYERRNFFFILTRTYSKLKSIMHRIFHTKIDGHSIGSKNEKAYLTTTKEDVFLGATRELVDELARELNVDNKPFVMFDQLVPPSNVKRYNRYVNNLKVIIVDRDPRDIYILEREVWRGTVIPTDNIESFCRWYAWTRSTANNNDIQNVLNIQFEDLLYNYSETVSKIEEFISLQKEQHTRINDYLNPEKLIKNIQLWKVYKQYDEEIRYISVHLPQFCYDFPDNRKIGDINVKELF